MKCRVISTLSLTLIFAQCGISLAAQSGSRDQGKRVAGQVQKANQDHLPVTNTTNLQPLTSREVVGRVSRSLVVVVTQDEAGQPIAQGSGFVFKEHLIATTLHVFKRASQGYVKLVNEGVTYRISGIVGIDVQNDLCVFEVAAISAPPLVLASGANLAVADEVYVAGNPKGLEGSFSKGIVSGLRLDQGVIQIDAAISAGSSGGPVVNNRAEVIGLAASSLMSGQNLNFAIPVSYLTALRLRPKAPIIIAGVLSLTDTENSKLKGPVATVTERTSFLDYNERTNQWDVEGPANLLDITAYDSAGNETGYTSYDHDKMVMKVICEFDQQGIRTRIRAIGHGGETIRVLSEIEGIDDKMSRIRFSTTDEAKVSDPKTGKEFVWRSETFDREGNKTEQFFYQKNPPERHVYTYDKEGFLVEEDIYREGKLAISYRYSYQLDQWGNWIRRYETFYLSKTPSLGYHRSAVNYRDITYHAK